MWKNSNLLCLLRVSWVVPYFVYDMLEPWRGIIGKGIRRGVTVMVTLCLMWCIWKARNRRIFEGAKLSLSELKFSFMRVLNKWSSKSYTFFTFSFLDFLVKFKTNFLLKTLLFLFWLIILQKVLTSIVILYSWFYIMKVLFLYSSFILSSFFFF